MKIDISHLPKEDVEEYVKCIAKYFNSTVKIENEQYPIKSESISYNLDNTRKMERQEVYKCLDTERLYQDLRWSPRREKMDTPDESKPPAEWINYIEYHIGEAKREVYMLNSEEALAHVRKVAALAVRCLEIHGCPERIIPDNLLKKNVEE